MIHSERSFIMSHTVDVTLPRDVTFRFSVTLDYIFAYTSSTVYTLSLLLRLTLNVHLFSEGYFTRETRSMILIISSFSARITEICYRR